MSDREVELLEKIAEMEGDIKASVAAFTFVLDRLGINLAEFRKEDENISDEDHALYIKSKMPSILGSLTRNAMGGGFNGATMSRLTELGPILNKYAHLVA